MSRRARMARLQAEGRDAMIAAWIKGAPQPPCPYSKSSKSALFWTDGASRTATLLDQVKRIGA
ncbi:MAG: hypothetical protein VX309_00545 [Pseudomonadota bacterium]|nr:hypothetical protein [Pseudomonadota bacterium]MEE3154001.1 hypothetical protein [Pseudomonadota bacterium]